MNSSDDISSCDKFEDGGRYRCIINNIKQKRRCTSYEQKVDNCNNSASDDNSSSCNSDIDTVAEGISRVNISNDNDTGGSNNDGSLCSCQMRNCSQTLRLNEDCEICMLPMPYASGVSKVRITYMPCFGKVLCEGCDVDSEIQMEKGNMKRLCAFCRVSINFTDKEYRKD